MLVIKEKIQWPLLVQSRILLLKKMLQPPPAVAANKQLHLTSKFLLNEWNITYENPTFPSGLVFSKRVSAA